MGEFQKIETQEQFDQAIGDRLKRERETQAKKYENYISPDDFKSKTEEYQKQIGDLNKALKEATDKAAGYDKTIAERDSKIKAYETRSVKMRIANEMGLSYDAVDFLKGEDEESIRKSATTLQALVGSNRPAAPLADTEGAGDGGTDAALRNTLRKLNKGV